MFGMMGAAPPKKTEVVQKEQRAQEAVGEVEKNVKILSVKQQAEKLKLFYENQAKKKQE